MFSRIPTTIAIILLSTTLGFTQIGDLPPNAEAGKCYAKCLLDDQLLDNIQSVEMTYPIYTGTDPKVKTKDITITIQPKKDVWAKNKETGQWDLNQEQPEIIKTITVPRKIRKVPAADITYTTYEVYTGELYLYKGGTSEWREVLCGYLVTKIFIRQLRLALIDAGYNLSDQNTTIDQGVKDALISYQKKNGLPIGALDFKSLKSLGVKY